jgi:glycosyltransferase involved in cell wall biosynthesis
MAQRPDFPPRNVLVVAYYFPPMGLSGVQRTLKFVKYFPDFGWHPTVLTVEPQGYLARDESLLREIVGKPIEVVRTPAAGPGRLWKKREVVDLPPERLRRMLSKVSDTFLIPDNKIGWKRRAVRKALELHAVNHFDMIFATAPPFSDFLIAAEIKRRINKPLVFDFRDPWVDYPFKFYPTPIHRLRHVQLERRAVRASSHIVVTNRNVKELLIARHKFLTYHDVDIIPQGFDPEDLASARQAGGSCVPKSPSKMRVTYAGIFWEDRVPDHFLQALAQLLKERPRLHGRIEAVFIGKFREENSRLVVRLGLQDSVRVLDYLPHDECFREILASDVVWMVVGDNVGSPGKTYEYIGAGKPILGLAPEGFIKQTILEAGGRVVEPHDVEGIKTALVTFFEEYEHHTLCPPTPDVIAKYDRMKLTRQLVGIFESLIAS